MPSEDPREAYFSIAHCMYGEEKEQKGDFWLLF